MAAPTNNKEYPQFFISDKTLLAFIKKDEMYKIEQVGSNVGNEGVCIDRYITRNMVLKHYGRGTRVTRGQFKTILEKLFGAYIAKILSE